MDHDPVLDAVGQRLPEPAEVLVLFGPRGERMHVRARPKASTRTD